MSPVLHGLAATGLGALAVAGYAPLGWFPLAILSLAGLFWLARATRPGRAFLLGWLYGLGLFLAGVSWIFVSLSTYGGMPAPVAVIATLLFCAFMALAPAATLALACRLTAPGPARALLALPGAWLLLEWTRGWIFSGFPWLALGYSQAPDSPLAGFAPVFGVYGVSLAAALLAGALALAATRGSGRRFAAILVLALPLAGFGLGQVAWTEPVGEPVSVALVQGNIAQDMKFRPDRLEATLRFYANAARDSEARLVVLPETAFPVFRSMLPDEFLEYLAEPARARGGDVVFGLAEDEGPERYFNSATSVGAAPEGGYRKHHLVPFGEFVPWGFRWLVDMMSIPLGDFTAGAADQGPIAAAGQRLALNICYEDAFGEERVAAARAATLLVNISNDAWFGASLAPWQHLQIGAMRSLEAGRWQLRANNTGITAILDERGRVRVSLAPFVTGTLNGHAQGRDGLTPFLRWGNAPAIVLAALLLAVARFFSSRISSKP